MIPLYLSLSGFLSYQDRVEIDFSSFNLACISGSNGAGKSSILDAITWTLFGQARKRDDSLVNSHSKTAEVVLVFAYEGNIYKIQRSKTRDKIASLEFQILQTASDQVWDQQRWRNQTNSGWKSLNERSLRETEAFIQQILHLDYDTFINASFFLQGKADQFTQQRPGDRKRILASILGLEVWENYRKRATDLRKSIESEISALDGRLAEIRIELAEADIRKVNLQKIEGELSRLTKTRQAQESILETARKVAAILNEQRKLVETMGRQLDAAERRLTELENSLSKRQNEKDSYTHILSRRKEIEAMYAAWQQSRADLQKWDEIAINFREHEKLRQPYLDKINTDRARLLQEQAALLAQQSTVSEYHSLLDNLKSAINDSQQSLAKTELELAQRTALGIELQTALQRQAEARAENPRLKSEMDDLKARIDQLQASEGVVCPICGQFLSESDRAKLINDLTIQGKDLGDRYRTNLIVLRESDQLVRDLEKQISRLSQIETEARRYTQTIAQLTERLEKIVYDIKTWETDGAVRLAEVTEQLRTESFALQARVDLAKIDGQLKVIGYDAAAHDSVRRGEAALRIAETEYHSLEKAQATLAPLDREITDLTKNHTTQQSEIQRQRTEYSNVVASLSAAQAQAPDLAMTERTWTDLQEQENRLRMELGAARQKVSVLADLAARSKILETDRDSLAAYVGQYKQLERAFGKDGVPALLIEQALPQIETKANELLDRLSDGTLTVHFATQAAFKDKNRDDLRETLDILISDEAGTRDYELFSGGEAFRINFAIRLALSEVLAQRVGARLQTLVIDEGFGSQDAQGRQRLIEAINLVHPDFAKILVITHIDELKDAFPTRIEVEKTSRGSTARVI
jgi:exonuclease SbcC